MEGKTQSVNELSVLLVVVVRIVALIAALVMAVVSGHVGIVVTLLMFLALEFLLAWDGSRDQ